VLNSRVALSVLVHLAKALLPEDASRAALTRGKTTFCAEYADTLLLLLRVDPDGEVHEGLKAAAGDGSRTGLPARRLDYQTQAMDKHAAAALLAAANRTEQDRALLVREQLGLGKHYVLPLRKRESADRISHDRVTVGRATNNDIVLRDGSVSKLHAWFLLHEEREFSVADADSTNHTAVNGLRLEPRKLRHLLECDRVELGAVSGISCFAETLWVAIHPEG
jgi:FHA domain